MTKCPDVKGSQDELIVETIKNNDLTVNDNAMATVLEMRIIGLVVIIGACTGNASGISKVWSLNMAI